VTRRAGIYALSAARCADPQIHVCIRRSTLLTTAEFGAMMLV